MKLRWWTETRHFWEPERSPNLALAGPRPTPIGIGTDEVWNGTGGDDTHAGTNGDDILDGKGGNDTIDGRKGNDDITGGQGNDDLKGGEGNDIIRAGRGTDVVDGGKGNDTIVMDAQGGIIASLEGGKGNDTFDASAVTTAWEVQALAGIERYILSDLDESLGGTILDEVMEGRGGNDNLGGFDGNDTVRGGLGDDTLFGGNGNDTIEGDEGFDQIIDEAGDDAYDGGDGFDYVYFSNSAVGVTASLKTGVATGNGSDTLENIEGLVGSTHSDDLTGSNADNNLAGLEGDDDIDGGKGVDWIYYNTASSNVTVNLQAGTASGALGNDTIQNVEGVVAGIGNDTLTGNKGANTLYGAGGQDTIRGGDGDDFCIGEDGNDILTGGKGLDVLIGGFGTDAFVFDDIGGSNPIHFITDHVFGETIDLSAIDAIRGGVDQAFIVVDEFNGAPGEAILTYDAPSNQTIIQLDTDGGANPTANFVIQVNGNITGGGEADIIW